MATDEGAAISASSLSPLPGTAGVSPALFERLALRCGRDARGPRQGRGAVAALRAHRYVYAPFCPYPTSRLAGEGSQGTGPWRRQRNLRSTMARLVMKFGGTSVADIERIRNVARHVKREVDAGHEVAVVVSAMSGATNRLVEWCREASALHDAREYDAVVASGEQVTSG